MRKLLFTSLLTLGLLLPTTFSASTNNISSVEFSSKKPRKSSNRRSARAKKAKSYKSKRSSSRSRSYSQNSKKCMYNGHELIVGPRGGCYYYSGSSKKYVDRAYCSSCN